MIKKTGLALMLIVLVNVFAINTVHARGAKPLLNPGPTEWGCSLGMDVVKKGVSTGILIKQWSATDSKPGFTRAKIIVRGKHTLVVDINYTTSNFDIKYNSSENLKYSVNSAGVEVIHPNANSWMNNLRDAIRSVLNGECK